MYHILSSRKTRVVAKWLAIKILCIQVATVYTSCLPLFFCKGNKRRQQENTFKSLGNKNAKQRGRHGRKWHASTRCTWPVGARQGQHYRTKRHTFYYFILFSAWLCIWIANKQVLVLERANLSQAIYSLHFHLSLSLSFIHSLLQGLA